MALFPFPLLILSLLLGGNIRMSALELGFGEVGPGCFLRPQPASPQSEGHHAVMMMKSADRY